MCRIICHTARLDEQSIDAARLVVDVDVAEPLLVDSIEKLVKHLQAKSRFTFRCVDFDGIEVHWQRVGPAIAQVYECQRGRLLRVHLLSRGPTGEVWWIKNVMNNLPSDASDLLALTLIVPSFAKMVPPSRVRTPGRDEATVGRHRSWDY
jgi:hypothetical protein